LGGLSRDGDRPCEEQRDDESKDIEFHRVTDVEVALFHLRL